MVPTNNADLQFLSFIQFFLFHIFSLFDRKRKKIECQSLRMWNTPHLLNVWWNIVSMLLIPFTRFKSISHRSSSMVIKMKVFIFSPGHSLVFATPPCKTRMLLRPLYHGLRGGVGVTNIQAWISSCVALVTWALIITARQPSTLMACRISREELSTHAWFCCSRRSVHLLAKHEKRREKNLH